MDEDETGWFTPPMPKFDPLKLTITSVKSTIAAWSRTKQTIANVKRMKKRPAAQKWVSKLCKVVLDTMSEWDMS